MSGLLALFWVKGLKPYISCSQAGFQRGLSDMFDP
jgi:hypothetical protein